MSGYPQNPQDLHSALDATQSASALAPSDHDSRRFAARWRELEPWARQHSQLTGTPIDALREAHRQRLLRCDALGLQMRVVRRNWLDDPRPSDDDFQRKLADTYKRRHKR